jgi:hypothetical protein
LTIAPAHAATSVTSLKKTHLSQRGRIFVDMSQSDAPESALSKYRYEALFGAWLAVTGVTFLRISRQPYSSRLKVEQYESIFKGTSLSAILIGIGITPARTTARRFASN